MYFTCNDICNAKNNHTPFALAYLTSHSLSSSLLISSLSTRAYCIYYALGYACSYLVPRFSFLLLASRHECFSHALYLDMHVMSYMRCLESRLYYVHVSLLYMYTSHLVLRGSMHLLHIIHYTTVLYLYSVLLGRARSAVVLQRLLNIRCLLFCSAPCSTSSRTSIRE